MRKIGVLGLAVFVLLTGCGGNTTPNTATESNTSEAALKKVYWIDSYDAEYEGSLLIKAGMQPVLENANVTLEIGYLDSKRVTELAAIEANAAVIKAAIDAFQPDVIIATDDNAQQYVVVPYALNKQVPVVFAGVNWDASIYGYPADNVTGMIEVDLGAQVVEILQDFTTGARVGYVAVDTETEQKISEWYNTLFFDGAMEVRLIPTYAELKTAFLQLQNEVDVILLGNSAGAPDWDDDDAQSFFFENTMVPTGTVQAWMAPYALVTLAKDPTEWGGWTLETALKIISGTSVADIPITQNERGEMTLNLNLANRLDIVFTPLMLRNAATVGGEETN